MVKPSPPETPKTPPTPETQKPPVNKDEQAATQPKAPAASTNASAEAKAAATPTAPQGPVTKEAQGPATNGAAKAKAEATNKATAATSTTPSTSATAASATPPQTQKTPPTPTMPQPEPRRKGGLPWGWALGAVALALLGGAVAVSANISASAGTLAQGISVGGVAVGGLTPEQAQDKVAAALSAPPITTVRAGDQSWQVEASELGWSRDEAEALAEAVAFSEARDWQDHLGEMVGQVSERDFPVAVTVDEKVAQTKLAELARPFEFPAEDGDIEFDVNAYAYKAVGGRDGKMAQVDNAAKAFAENPQVGELNIGFQPQITPYSASSLAKHVQRGNALIRPLTVQLSNAETAYPLNKRQVANLFWATRDGIKPDVEAIDSMFGEIASRIHHPATPARFVREGGQWVPREGQAGEEIDLKAARSIFERDVLNPEANASVWPSKLQPPTFTVADLPDPKTLELVATGDSIYNGSSAARRENIRVAAEKLDGYVIPADADFSFLQAIGSITAESGFVDGLIISGGQTVDGLGGGVCQVSTTAFRGLYNAGLPVVERNQHSYRVPYYEPQTGFEAAVYDPGLDLKMHNDTGAPLVVKAINNDPESRLRIELWGRKPNRTVEVSDAVITGTYGIPSPRYVPTSSLPAGQTKVVEGGRPGMKMYIKRTITDENGTHTERLDTFYEPQGTIIHQGVGGGQ